MSRFVERLGREIEASGISPLRRHIIETLDLTPEQYLERYGEQIKDRLIHLRQRGERKITVAIPAANEEDSILRCLKGVAEQFLPLFYGADILVVSQSEDRTTSLARQVGAIVIEDEKKGQGRARKLGFEHKENELIFFIDADAIPVRTWLTSMIVFHQEHPNLAAIYGPSIFYRGDQLLYTYNVLGELSKWARGHYCGRNSVYTSAVRELVLEEGRDLIAEDGRLYKALKKRGLAQGWNMSPEATVLTTPRGIEKEGVFKAGARRAAHLFLGYEGGVARRYRPDLDPNDPEWTYIKRG